MYVVTGVVTKLGQVECEIEVRENWGIRVVVLDTDGKEKVVWGRELKRCASDQELSPDDPYQAKQTHKRNRHLLKKIKPGTVVAYPCGQEYIETRVLRVVRAGCWQRVMYTVPIARCLHDNSVRCTKRMIDRARRDNRLWGAGLRPPPSISERHVVTPETYEHLRKWIFSTELLEPLKASEQSTQRGHCFANKEAVSATFSRYQKSADQAAVDPVSERVYRSCIHTHTRTHPSPTPIALALTTHPQASSFTEGLHKIPQGSLHVHHMSAKRMAWDS